ncbi:hypothetical protein [uncultured Lutibacter sp.]|uniref:hypothetical protein n=1 Tax=uncultured Lutibacter sp. TaxID=437739 RepID=UPI002620859F|nr:hypothetical protein [uncultured Lutibacter sp.]
MQETKFIKKYSYLIVLFFVSITFAQNRADMRSIDVDIPTAFFNEMFRSPTDKHLVAWSGGLKVIVKNQEGKEIQVEGVIKYFEDYLNSELTNLGRRQFKYNLNTPIKRVSSPDKKSWAGHCGYDPYHNVTFNDIKNGANPQWPAEITSEVWGLNLSKKTVKQGTLTNGKTGIKEAVSFYFNANSIYYYHKIKPQDLKGKINRDDNYKACGKVGMYRLGPGHSRFKRYAEVEAGEFNFDKRLFLGDYQVQYLWPDGTFQVLEEYIVYDPFGNPVELEYELKTFVGKISGTLVHEETKKPVKNQKVTLKPVCEASEIPEKEKKTDGEGKFEFTEVPNGVYYVVTKGAPDTMAGLTKDPALRLREIEVKQNSKYDIYATYTAYGFAKAELVWRNATIKFPEEGESPQLFDMMAFRNSGDYDNPTGTDGEPLKIPYTTVVPGIGKQTLYAWPESETATPEVISVRSLVHDKTKGMIKFMVDLEEDALNTCNISQDNNGPIYLDIGFDLNGAYDAGKDLWMQVEVGTREDKVWNAMRGNSLNGHPLSFKRYHFKNDEIEKFKNGEALEIFLTGQATLKIEFRPLENE